jgi:hypothetical protein
VIAPLIVSVPVTANTEEMNERAELVVGAVAAPPPSRTCPAPRSSEDAQVDALEKYGIPPEVPATVRAGVLVAVAMEINPPVKDTLVTVPEPAPLFGKSADVIARNAGTPVPPETGPRNAEFCATLLSMKVSAGVVPAVATLVVKSGLRAPALNDVTVPEPAPATGISAGTSARNTGRTGSKPPDTAGPARTKLAATGIHESIPVSPIGISPGPLVNNTPSPSIPTNPVEIDTGEIAAEGNWTLPDSIITVGLFVRALNV